VCQMIAYNETLITTNFQFESIIGLRDMGGQSSQNSLKIRVTMHLFGQGCIVTTRHKA